MSNKHLSSPPSSVLLARLKVLLESVNQIYQSNRMVLESDLVSGYHEALDLFFESLDNSLLASVYKIYAGAPSDPLQFNIFTRAILKDLEALFLELAAVDKLIAGSFNSVISERNQVLQISKRIGNKLGDYLLYADPSLGGGFFFGDSFNTGERIEIGSSLVDGEECYLGLEEGVVLLPLDGEPDRPIVQSIIINKPSNGAAGSNYQLDVFGHKEIETISDNEPNTWYEYERVTAYSVNESSVPLVLDLTIVLEEVSVINHININPINFGTPTPVKIASLETSKDGIEYTSIKDEVPVKDFAIETEKEEFDLSPATSKYAGQASYSFLPRKAQYIHIVLRQYTPYSIETNSGLRLRYAIGLRDINVLGRKFKTEGSLVSTTFSLDGDARKIALWASENPTEKSSLADITHSISYNDGAVWLPLQPQRRDGIEIPEVLNFNNISQNSIETEIEVNNFRHKISMKREPKEFKGNITLKEEKLPQIDIINTPSGSSYDIFLSKTPIKESVRVLLPFLGSYSCPRPRYGDSVAGQSTPKDFDFVEFAVDGGAIGTLRYKLPWRHVPNLEYKIRVFVNGEQIEYIAKDETILDTPSYTSYASSIDSDSKVYFLNKSGRELQFGFTDSDGDQRGFLPPGGAKIKVCLDGDNPYLRLSDKGYILRLTSPSDGFKENLSLYCFGNMEETEAFDYEIEIPAGQKKATDSLQPNSDEASKSDVIVNFPVKSQLFKPSITQPFRKSPLINQGNSPEEEVSSDYEIISDYIPPSSVPEEQVPQPEISSFVLEREGLLPPLFLSGTDNFEIKEYDLLTGELLTPTSTPASQFVTKVSYVDGHAEFLDAIYSAIQPDRYTFDSEQGVVWLGDVVPDDRRVVLVCKKLEAHLLPSNYWEYNRNTSTGQINTQELILNPQVIYAYRKVIDYTYEEPAVKAFDLLSASEESHDWYKQQIIRGTVKPKASLFSTNAKPIEVPFINGRQEFHNEVLIEDEVISFTDLGSSLYSFSLQEISSLHGLEGSPGFAPIRGINNISTPVSQFTTQIESTVTPSSEGEWNVVVASGIATITLYSASSPNDHCVSYRYKDLDPGLDLAGLYSVDYVTGTIHFAESLSADGDVSFEVSLYSAFYNIAQNIAKGDIDKIDEEAQTITFSTALGMRFLKLDTTEKARPSIFNIFYNYYKKSSESLEDLEPYFSPICKDVAIKAITSSLFEDL